MAQLNLSDQPSARGQQSTEVGPSDYALGKTAAGLSGDFIAPVVSSAWAAATGTADRTTFATYTAPTISNPPTQAEVQAVANAVQVLSRHMKALVDDLKAKGAI